MTKEEGERGSRSAGREERLRELAETGALSGLPGEGKPFPKDAGDLAGDRWAAFHVMQNEKVLPPWAELRRDIDGQLAALVGRACRHLAWLSAREAQLRGLPAERIVDARRATREADAKVRAEIAAAVAELNKLVARFDLMVPVPSLQLLPLTVTKVFDQGARSEGAGS